MTPELKVLITQMGPCPVLQAAPVHAGTEWLAYHPCSVCPRHPLELHPYVIGSHPGLARHREEEPFCGSKTAGSWEACSYGAQICDRQSRAALIHPLGPRTVSLEHCLLIQMGAPCTSVISSKENIGSVCFLREPLGMCVLKQEEEET